MIKDKIVNMIGLKVGAIIAFLLTCYHLFLMPSHGRQEFLTSLGGWLMISGVLLGGAISGFIIETAIIYKLTRTGSIWGCIIGSILISPLSMYLGIILSTISGGMGENLGRKIGIEDFGIRIGIFIGIILFIVVVELIGALIGAVLGFFAESLTRMFYTSFGKKEK